MQNSVAMITARGGSKRIPRKNIKEFCGKPMIAYSIQAALESGVFNEVMVSTDDAEIAEVAKAYGAVVPFMRSEQAANDYATTADVVREVLSAYEQQGKHFDCFCVIYPTAPLLNYKYLQQAKTMIDAGHADMIVTVTKFSFPPQRAFVQEKGLLEYKWKENKDKRSQDLEELYQDAGQFYFGLTDSFNREGTLIMQRSAPIVLSELEVQDIDHEADWQLAELKYRLLKEEQNLESE